MAGANRIQSEISFGIQIEQHRFLIQKANQLRFVGMAARSAKRNQAQINTFSSTGKAAGLDKAI